MLRKYFAGGTATTNVERILILLTESGLVYGIIWVGTDLGVDFMIAFLYSPRGLVDIRSCFSDSCEQRDAIR